MRPISLSATSPKRIPLAVGAKRLTYALSLFSAVIIESVAEVTDPAEAPII